MEKNYYSQKLNSQKLFKVYDTQLPRIIQYLEAEISYVNDNLMDTEHVLELGAGYGRIIKELAPSCKSVIGVDISVDNVILGKEYLRDISNASIEVMDVHNMKFEKQFDAVLCLQNGLSAMRASEDTIQEILSLVNPGGKAYFSSYSDKFWNHRLQWFHEQAFKGLLGKLDMEKTKDGVIVCDDGFRSMTHSFTDLDKIGKSLGYQYLIKEIDESSVFLVITV